MTPSRKRRVGPGLAAWLVAIGLMAVGVLTLGIPGAVLFELFLALLGPAAGVPPDSAWPIAIYLSLLAPLGLPLAQRVARRAPRGWRLPLGAAVWVGLDLLLAALFYRLALP